MAFKLFGHCERNTHERPQEGNGCPAIHTFRGPRAFGERFRARGSTSMGNLRAHLLSTLPLTSPLSWLFFLTFCVAICYAPKGQATSSVAAAGASSSSNASAAALAAAAAAAAWMLRKKRTEADAVQGTVSVDEPREDPYNFEPSACASEEDSEAASSSDESWDSTQEVEGCVEMESEPADAAASQSSGKLWSRRQFPEGVFGSANWDMANLEAAQEWECPCPDRFNCIGKDRIPNIFDLYEHRKKFRTVHAPAHGGLRDASRLDMSAHYDVQSKSLTRSFRVGPVGDCCAASDGLAKGMSFATWAGSRSDLHTANGEAAPWREGRRQIRNKQETEKRAHFRAWIRSLRDGMEGPKGGSDPVRKWKTAYIPRHKRWEIYCESRRRSGQPILGGKDLL